MVRTKEEVSDDWQKGIIIKLPKKDLSQCGNWRDICLLSIPGKVFYRVLLHRVKANVEIIQAGFRSRRSCVDQIFVLMILIELSLEQNSPLFTVHQFLGFLEGLLQYPSQHSMEHSKIL